ncbi:helicase-related protein [Poseidonibacter ostreae]|jgi:ATP-dependent RNA helicase SUPV3L1/SUV3|uniref:RNA helicase n=1 Tax=Poseidonibacter ostreae TaxID=2654171 RepID=A0A6L4WT16_9BACT|nr:helicase-related protein [Poseidonibacter ostreae]KAB7886692.1 RNA helicase [Poseidonibacter ostreae]KAB7889084.1 RNA helicase [Poseidonibacter ostreae]KAB7891777.1 RNA helicase [Poseidonibacter ostreae]
MKENWQEQLHTLLNCDLKELYPLARSLNRKLEFYVGPTNSGKTYNAMEKLKQANSGLYLAPLRLLALEGYEGLKKDGIEASLITGEEQMLNEDAAHVCSTIEMIDYDLDVDVAVIDEVQMLDDIDRGWAWVNAIIGCPAKKVIMTGSVNALEAIKKIATYLGEELEVVRHKRKTELKVNEKYTSLDNLEDGTALIAFSRADVLKLRHRLKKNYTVSVIYGNLSPEVRRDEARKFRENKSQILIATDAIAMGLNLPIKTILFTTDTKFDGVSRRKITVNEIVQIAGRAGRYGHFEAGFLGATRRDILKHISQEYKQPIKTIKPPFRVKINAQQLESLSSHIKTTSLTKILKFFAENMSFSGPFIAANISSMITASKIVDTRFSMKLEDKYLLAQAPITTRSPIILQAYEAYIAAVVKQKVCNYKPSITLPKKAITQKDLLLVEDEVKKISLYLWLSYKLPEIFPDHDKAYILRNTFNSFIENSLKGKIIQIDTPRRNDFKRKTNEERRPRRDEKTSSTRNEKELRPRRARSEFKPRRRRRD